MGESVQNNTNPLNFAGIDEVGQIQTKNVVPRYLLDAKLHNTNGQRLNLFSCIAGTGCKFIQIIDLVSSWMGFKTLERCISYNKSYFIFLIIFFPCPSFPWWAFRVFQIELKRWQEIPWWNWGVPGNFAEGGFFSRGKKGVVGISPGTILTLCQR